MKNKKFEYGFISIDEDFGFYIFKGDRINKINSSHRVYNIEDALDSLGNQGWELCGINKYEKYIFKRELIEEEAKNEDDEIANIKLGEVLDALKDTEASFEMYKIICNGRASLYRKESVDLIDDELLGVEVDYVDSDGIYVNIYLKDDEY